MKTEDTDIIKRAVGEEAKTERTKRNISNTLAYSLSSYGFNKKDINNKTKEILKIHGMSDEDFDVINKAHKLIVNKINDESADPNANKDNKTISSIMVEANIPNNKAVGYDFLYRKMVEKYGKNEAKRLSGLMYDFSLPIHDSSNILKFYCWALDASHIVFEGRPFGMLKSTKPKTIQSYVSALNETVHQMSNVLAGAVAVGTFFSDLAYILINREKLPLQQLKTQATEKKRLENAMQNFVHSVNHLSRASNESPFTNVSVFDRPKLRAIFAEDNMGWILHTEEGEIELEYFLDYIEEVQDVFLNFFDKGDPLENGTPYRFPVVTIAISKDINNKIDKDSASFLSKICKLDISRYNIFTSLGMKICSCCRLVNDAELNSVGSQVNSFGGSAISMGSHRVVLVNLNRISLLTKNLSKETFYDLLNKRVEDAVKILYAHRELLKELDKSELNPFIKLGWINPRKMFSTVGLIGFQETLDTFNNNKVKESEKIKMEGILTDINKEVKRLSTLYNMPINIEQVPGEAMAVRLADVDRILYGEELVPYKLYSNQFIPLWEDATLWERMDVDGKYNQKINGGGIVHFNLGEKTTPQQNEMLIRYAINSGCEHFALNAVYSQCENGHTSFGDLSTCPTCGGKITDKLTRVVGFFTRVSSWNKTRREWEFPRRHFKRIDE